MAGANSADADAARARLAGALLESGRTPSPAVQAAFRAVPRHLFVPGFTPAAAYQDEALVVKYGADGVPVSSSSQPAMMAIMLEQLGLEPGHRVLEIGTGTGYNAAVMAHVVGTGGRVVTVDIDAELVAGARASLAAAGYDRVLARCADGGYADPGDDPFDRVIVTAGAWDIAPAWLDQLAPGGRLVLPLAVRGIQLSVALERGAEDCWVSRSAFRCGFVRMAGAFADPEAFAPLGDPPGRYVQVGDSAPVDLAALAAALAAPATEAGTGIQAGGRDDLSNLDLWLTLTESGLDRLAFMETSPGEPGGPRLPLGGLARRGDGTGEREAARPEGMRGALGLSGIAGARPDGTDGAPGIDRPDFPGEIVLRSYGPDGPALAAHLARRAQDWDRLGRPGADSLCLTVCPAGADPAPPAGQLLLRRPHVRLTAGWPAR
jgi:protein-L-isoaspartate(D-aspartate) O-methyltransferase